MHRKKKITKLSCHELIKNAVFSHFKILVDNRKIFNKDVCKHVIGKGNFIESHFIERNFIGRNFKERNFIGRNFIERNFIDRTFHR